MYEKIKKMHDNFIFAAANAEDPYMKSYWTYLAERMSKLLKLYSNYQVKEFD